MQKIMTQFKNPVWLWLMLFALLPFHAFGVTFLKSGLGIRFPESTTLIHAWKEIILGLIGLISVYQLVRRRWKIPKLILIDYLIIAYFLVGIIITLFVHKNFVQSLYGFKYDYLFLIAYGLARVWPWQKDDLKKLINIMLWCGGFTVLFGLIWYYCLPRDFLKYFGYTTDVGQWEFGDILPIYHLTDRFSDRVRLASTFSGPNHLGAFLLLFIPLLGSQLFYRIRQHCAWKIILLGTGGLAMSLFALYLTFSRSAWIGLIAIVFASGLLFTKQHPRLFKSIVISIVAIITTLTIVLIFNFQTISNYILHCSEDTVAGTSIENNFIKCSSTRGHFDRTWDGIQRTIKAPLGYGLGSAGPASDYNANHEEGIYAFHPENWYLQIFVEMGWGGGILFLVLIIMSWIRLWKNTQTPEGRWLFLSLTGISVMALFLHAWEDPATAIVFWAGLGIFFRSKVKGQKGK